MCRGDITRNTDCPVHIMPGTSDGASTVYQREQLIPPSLWRHCNFVSMDRDSTVSRCNKRSGSLEYFLVPLQHSLEGCFKSCKMSMSCCCLWKAGGSGWWRPWGTCLRCPFYNMTLLNTVEANSKMRFSASECKPKYFYSLTERRDFENGKELKHNVY